MGFSYTDATVDPSMRAVSGLDDLPDGFDPRGLQWVDLDGEGLTGMLTESGGAWFYKRNEGSGSFAPLRQLTSRPAIGAGSPV